MNIAVVAANGRSGKVFVEYALAAGHSVRAGIHRTNNLDDHPNLSTTNCDATKESDLSKLVHGQDAVISFIGHIKDSPPFVQTDAMKALVRVMQAEGLTRVVSLTGTGVRFAGDRVPLIDRILNLSIRIIDPARVKDGREHVQVLKESNLDWTVVRVLKLQYVKPKSFKLTLHGPTKWYVSREEVAKAALQILEENSFIRQAPIISKV